MNVRWTTSGLEALGAIERFIERDNPNAAKRVVKTILRHAQELRDFPQMGPPASATTRHLRVPKLPFRIIYSVADRDVLIVSVQHDARFID